MIISVIILCSFIIGGQSDPISSQTPLSRICNGGTNVSCVIQKVGEIFPPNSNNTEAQAIKIPGENETTQKHAIINVTEGNIEETATLESVIATTPETSGSTDKKDLKSNTGNVSDSSEEVLFTDIRTIKKIAIKSSGLNLVKPKLFYKLKHSPHFPLDKTYPPYCLNVYDLHTKPKLAKVKLFRPKLTNANLGLIFTVYHTTTRCYRPIFGSDQLNILSTIKLKNEKVSPAYVQNININWEEVLDDMVIGETRIYNPEDLYQCPFIVGVTTHTVVSVKYTKLRFGVNQAGLIVPGYDVGDKEKKWYRGEDLLYLPIQPNSTCDFDKIGEVHGLYMVDRVESKHYFVSSNNKISLTIDDKEILCRSQNLDIHRSSNGLYYSYEIIKVQDYKPKNTTTRTRRSTNTTDSSYVYDDIKITDVILTSPTLKIDDPSTKVSRHARSSKQESTFPETPEEMALLESLSTEVALRDAVLRNLTTQIQDNLIHLTRQQCEIQRMNFILASNLLSMDPLLESCMGHRGYYYNHSTNTFQYGTPLMKDIIVKKPNRFCNGRFLLIKSEREFDWLEAGSGRIYSYDEVSCEHEYKPHTFLIPDYYHGSYDVINSKFVHFTMGIVPHLELPPLDPMTFSTPHIQKTLTDKFYHAPSDTVLLHPSRFEKFFGGIIGMFEGLNGVIFYIIASIIVVLILIKICLCYKCTRWCYKLIYQKE